MRFEIPTINISMFEVENVITSDPSGVNPESHMSATQRATENVAKRIEGTAAVLAFN